MTSDLSPAGDRCQLRMWRISCSTDFLPLPVLSCRQRSRPSSTRSTPVLRPQASAKFGPDRHVSCAVRSPARADRPTPRPIQLAFIYGDFDRRWRPASLIDVLFTVTVERRPVRRRPVFNQPIRAAIKKQPTRPDSATTQSCKSLLGEPALSISKGVIATDNRRRGSFANHRRAGDVYAAWIGRLSRLGNDPFRRSGGRAD